jgi:hypothetical protein
MLLIQATDSDGSQLAPPYADMNSMWSNIRDTNYPVAVLQSVCLSSLRPRLVPISRVTYKSPDL